MIIQNKMESFERTLTKNKDVDKLILSNLDDETLFDFCKIDNKYVHVLCSDESFWLNRVNSKYPLLKDFKSQNQTWRQFFIRITHYITLLNKEFGIPYIPTKSYNPEKFYNDWLNLPWIFIEAMYWAAKGGHLEIVQYLIEKGEETNQQLDFNSTMYSAAEGGHLDIIKLMIEKGADDFNDAMAWAATGGHLDIVKYLIQKGATNYSQAMECAERGRRPEVVNYLEQFFR